MSVLFVLFAAVPSGGDAGAGRDELYRAGVERRIGGDETRAIADFQSLLERDPHDLDARLQLGLALAAAGRSSQATAALEAVLRAAPDYDDARVALARLALADGRPDRARALLAPVLGRGVVRGAAPGDPAPGVYADAAALSIQIDRFGLAQSGPERAEAGEAQHRDGASGAVSPRWRLDADAAHSTLTGGLPAWREADLSVSRKIGRAAAVTGRVEALERFDKQETYVEAEYDRGWSGGEWFAALGGSLDPTFRPETALKAGVLVIPAPGSQWRISADVNLSRYVVGDVTTLRIGAARAFGRDVGTIGARWITTIDERDETLEGYALDTSWRVVTGMRALATYSDAPESSDGRTTPVKAFALGADIDIDPRTTLHGVLTEEQRHASYDRLEFSLGVTKRF
jgi:YaiO family outer membrane protein